MKLSPKVIFALFFIFMFNAFNDAFAAQVAAVKGKQVLILGDNLETGGLYYVVNQGKKRGIIRVVKIKGRKALAQLLKGSAGKGYNLVYRPKKAAGATSRTAQRPTSGPSKSGSKNYDKFSEKPSSSFDNKSGYRSSSKKSYSIGGMLAYHQNSAEVQFPGGAVDSLSGSAIGFKVFGDYPLFDNVHIRGEFGTIPFQAEGDLICPDANTCNMNINYLGATLWARYMFGSESSKTRFWGGAGASLVFPTGTGDTNAVNTDDIGSTLIFNFGGGADYKINDKYYIPFSAEYSLFPPNDTVSANMIIIKAGLGMRL